VPIVALNNYAHYHYLFDIANLRVAGLLEQPAVIVKTLKRKE